MVGTVQAPSTQQPFIDQRGCLTTYGQRWLWDSWRITGGYDGFTTSTIEEGSDHLFFTTARARAAIAAAGSLAYNSTTGVVSYTTPNSDGITEGAANLYFTSARARSAISVSGSLSYNPTTGVISYTTPATPTTDGITEGATNKYYTDARARSALSGSGGVSYNSGTGAITLTAGAPTWDVSGNLTATSFNVSGSKVVGARATGWGAASGTLSRSAYASYAGQAVSAAYVQAEAQATDDAVKALSRLVAALITDLTAHGLIGT